MIKKGQVVKIKKEYQNPGEENLTFIALDDEDKGRVTIGSVEAAQKFNILPREVVSVDMLETEGGEL